MTIAVIAITRHGIALAERVVAALPSAARLFAPEKFRLEAEQAAPGAVQCYEGKLGDQMPALWAHVDSIIAIVSVGAVVRLIAPHLKNKATDPAVVVMDEAGQFVIPVLSGHTGGANALADHLATLLGATPVLTTASDVRATLAVDLLGRELGWRIEATHDEIVRASAAMVNDLPVALVQEAGSPDWWQGHANGRSGPRPANVTLFARLEEVEMKHFETVLWVSHRRNPVLPGMIVYRPPRLSVGVGCDRNTPVETLQRVLDEALLLARADRADIVTVASIDLKADEPGLCALAERQGWRIQFYPAEQLAKIVVPNPSETVRRHTGTPSVSEAAALMGGGTLIVEKHKGRGDDGRCATISISRITYG